MKTIDPRALVVFGAAATCPGQAGLCGIEGSGAFDLLNLVDAIERFRVA